jgi:hypothetical protein
LFLILFGPLVFPIVFHVKDSATARRWAEREGLGRRAKETNLAARNGIF